MFEQMKPRVGAEVGRMLERLELKLDRGKGNKTEAQKALSVVDESIVKAKKKLEVQFDFDASDPESIARITNAWKAWDKQGVLEGDDYRALRGKLQGLETKDDSIQRFARQVWRTEMTSYCIQKLQEAKREDKGQVMEKIMASQIVKKNEDDPREVIQGAIHLDLKLGKADFRKILSEKMQRSEQEGTVDSLTDFYEKKGLGVQKIEVVTGGEFLSVPLELSGEFQFKNLVLDGNSIYGQMKNGCRGNFVKITLEKKLSMAYVARPLPGASRAEESIKGEVLVTPPAAEVPVSAPLPVASESKLIPVESNKPISGEISATPTGSAVEPVSMSALEPKASVPPSVPSTDKSPTAEAAPVKDKKTFGVVDFSTLKSDPEPIKKEESTGLTTPSSEPEVSEKTVETVDSSKSTSTAASVPASMPAAKPEAPLSAAKPEPLPRKESEKVSSPPRLETETPATVSAPEETLAPSSTPTPPRAEAEKVSSVPDHVSSTEETLAPPSGSATTIKSTPTAASLPIPSTSEPSSRETPAPEEAASVPVPISATEEPHPSPIETHPKPELKDVTPEKLQQAKTTIQKAHQKILNEVIPSLERRANAEPRNSDLKNGLRLIRAYKGKPFDAQQFLPLVIKESRLNPEATDPTAAGKGYFQIEPIVESEIEKYYGYKASATDKVSNAVLGLLYFDRCRSHYAEQPIFSALAPEQKDRLAFALYNKGYTHLKKMWEILKPNSYTGFEKKLSEALVDQLKGVVAVEKIPKESRSTRDESYGAIYEEYPGVTVYLECLKSDSGKSALQKPFTLNGQDTGMQIRQAAIMLRYVPLIEGIQEALPVSVSTPSPVTPERPTPTASTTSASREAAPRLQLKAKYTVKPGETLWSIGQQYGVGPMYLRKLNRRGTNDIKIGEVLKVPGPHWLQKAEPYFYKKEQRWIGVTPGKGFYTTLVSNPEYNRYLKEEVQFTKEDIEEVIIDFNQRFNPEWDLVNEQATNIPEQAQIWIPNVQYFTDYFAGNLDQGGPKLTLEEKTESPLEIQEPPQPQEEKALPNLPEDLTLLSERLDRGTIGQYVKKENGRWVRDKDAIKEGAKSFDLKRWNQHPGWNEANLKDRTLGKVTLEDVRFIILHSTISDTSASTINDQKAHFVIEKDGTIKYLAPIQKEVEARYKVPPHAGVSAWNGVQDLNRHAIGIEVVALEGVSWTPEQYKAAKTLVHWMGGYFGLKKRDVLMHKQVSHHRRPLMRGRKSDPSDEPSVLFKRLKLPNNSLLLDMEVAQGKLDPNLKDLTPRWTHIRGAWDGISAAADVYKAGPESVPSQFDTLKLAQWKAKIESERSKGKLQIVNHSVVKGDNLSQIARRYETTVDIVKAYNELNTPALRIGQTLKIPKSIKRI